MNNAPFVYWDQSPDLFSLGPFRLRWYTLFFTLAFFLGFLFMAWVFRREGKSEHHLARGLLYVWAATILGMRLGHCFFYEPAYYVAHPLEIFQVWKGGLASHGGFIGIFVALYFYARHERDLSYLWLLDRIAIPAALACCLIRFGNLFNSEVIGEPATIPWAFIFARVDELPRHPAQLYEAISYGLILLLLLWLYHKFGSTIRPGLLFGLGLVTAATARFLIDFVKAPQTAYEAGWPLSVGQFLSIPAMILGVVLLTRVVTSDGSAAERVSNLITRRPRANKARSVNLLE